ncbi:phosphatidate cytidylyltransferase [Desnuesiella massiliensis]|uniref:phosphatidate cytidylyltransferase n=1 Tax=Desnuesiella massiliensis TaxID=1650662 RepID=UPI0006E36633|nr:phosphatidate cytidylyltransferase [Desnuesiella massiliensis]
MKQNSRYLGAIIISPLIIFLFLGGVYLKALVLIMSLIGMNEFFNIMKNKNINPLKYFAFATCIIYYVFNLSLGNLFYILMLLLFILLCIPVIDTKYNFIDIAVTFLGLLYVGVLFSFIPQLYTKDYGSLLIWIIFISSWLCDTTAYYTGRFFGKRKLCPKVSPKKTIEGSIGGLLGSAIACGLYGIFLTRYIPNIAIYHYFIIGAICGVFCQFGDLFASSVKRFVGVKDYSNLIPGHGGILDRFDSILFASMVTYYYVTFILGI